LFKVEVSVLTMRTRCGNILKTLSINTAFQVIFLVALSKKLSMVY
jgi:hypothetical protein